MIRLLVSFRLSLAKRLKKEISSRSVSMMPGWPGCCLIDSQTRMITTGSLRHNSILALQTENVEGLGGEPEPEQGYGSMSSGSLRRYRAHVAQDTFQGFRGALRDASIGDPPAPAFTRVSPDNAQLPPSLS